MKIARSRAELDVLLSPVRAAGSRTGFVPTMGALHEGHLSLVRLARRHSDVICVSIFVNPTQFAPHEDFDAYPRQEACDLALLQQEGADFVFLPRAEELYSGGYNSAVQPGAAAQGLESDFRPHFFGGVVNVVYRLFETVKPDIAIFGEKDYQQFQVIAEMAAAQDLPIRIISAPIARDKHGLALSSRNAYLSDPELTIARTLNRVLFDTAASIQDGEDEEQTCAAASARLLEEGFRSVDYVAVRWGRVLGAAWLGKTRLIDNVPVYGRSPRMKLLHIHARAGFSR